MRIEKKRSAFARFYALWFNIKESATGWEFCVGAATALVQSVFAWVGVFLLTFVVFEDGGAPKDAGVPYLLLVCSSLFFIHAFVALLTLSVRRLRTTGWKSWWVLPCSTGMVFSVGLTVYGVMALFLILGSVNAEPINICN